MGFLRGICAKKAKATLLAKKVLVIQCLRMYAVLFTSITLKGRNKIMENIMSTYCKRKNPFQQDNVRVQICAVTMVKFHQLGYKLLPHSLDLPDLASYEYFLFPHMKKWFSRKSTHFGGLQDHVLEVKVKTAKRWTKCIKLK